MKALQRGWRRGWGVERVDLEDKGCQQACASLKDASGMVSRTRSVDGTEVKIDLQIVLEGCLHESGIVRARRGGQTGEGGCFPRRRGETTVGTISDRCFLLNAKYGRPLSDLHRMQQPSLNPPALPAAPRSASTSAKAILTML